MNLTWKRHIIPWKSFFSLVSDIGNESCADFFDTKTSFEFLSTEVN